MKKIGVLVLVLCMMFFSAMSTFAADVDKADVIIGGENTSASQTNKRDAHTVSTEETLVIDDVNKNIDVTLSLKTTKAKTTAVDTGDTTPVLLLIAIMALSAVAGIVLIRKKKFGKVMSAILCVAMLMTGFMANPGTTEALDFSNSNVEVAFTNEILEAFEFDQIVSITGGTYTLDDGTGTVKGIKWELGDAAKNKSQKLVYRLKMKDVVSDSLFGTTMNIAKTTFDIGMGVTTISFPKTSVKLGVQGLEFFTVAKDSEINGTFSITPGTATTTGVNAGATVTVTAAPSAGYKVGSVTVNGTPTVTPSGSGNNWTFTMPGRNVTVNVTFVVDTAEFFTVEKGSETNGTFEITPGTATTTGVNIGATVTVTAAPSAGYKVGSVTVNGTPTVTPSGSGNNWTFTMPGRNVTVNVTFIFDGQLHDIDKTTPANGSFDVSHTTAVSGTMVTISSITANSGYEVDTVSVYTTGDPATTVTVNGTGNSRTFTMPNYGVTVTVTFKMSSPAVTGFTVQADSTATGGTQTATSSNFTLNLAPNATQDQIITLTGLVTGTNLPSPALTTWTRGGANDWGAESSDATTYTVTIPAGATGSMTVTAVPKDDPGVTPIVVTIRSVFAEVTRFVVDWESYSGNYYTVKNLTSPQTGAAAKGCTGVFVHEPYNITDDQFTHGSTSEETQSRVWGATVTTTAADKSSTWTIMNDGNAGAGIAAGLAWDTETGTTNFLNIPADYSGTITVRVAATANPSWYTEFDIVVAPRPTIATAGRILDSKQTGDTAGVTWVEVATMTVGGEQYSLILRRSVIATDQQFNTLSNRNNYANSNVRTKINEWYADLSSGSGLRQYAGTHNALNQLGTTYAQVDDGFSVPSGDLAGIATEDIAFAMSSGEAIEFCSKSRCSQDGVTLTNGQQMWTNWELLNDETSYDTWLRSPGAMSYLASHVDFTGYVNASSVTRSGSYTGVRPAMWVKSEIFEEEPENNRLYYSEGNATYGGTTAYVPSDAIAGSASADTSFTINLTSPIGAATTRFFSMYTGISTAYTGIAAANWVISDASITKTEVTANHSYGVSIPVGYTGTFTLEVGSEYTVTFNVTASRAMSTDVKVGETFEESGVEWRVLAKGKGINGTETGSETDALIIAEHVLFDACIHAPAHSTWDRDIGWGGSDLRNAINGVSSTTNTAAAYAWYNGLDPNFLSSVVETTIKTKREYDGSTGNYVSLANQEFFLLSEDEVFGRSLGGNISNNLYAGKTLFADIHSRKSTTLASGSQWWLRSPRNLGFYAANVNSSSGNVFYNYIDYSRGVRPACVINL